jgi:hypothetical protein
MPELCPCIYPDIDPETETCACGHAPDEHDETGQCQVPDEYAGDTGS